MARSKANQLLTVRGIIKAARAGQTQHAFAAQLGIRQDLLSKYETGRVNPPAAIVETCMRLVHTGSGNIPPSADAIAKKIRLELASPEFASARAAIANLIDALLNAARSRHFGSKEGI